MAMNRDECFKQEQKTAGRKKRVAAYCRVSTDREDQANSFESQCAFFRQYIERNAGWELYEIFADAGITGTNTKKRREFNRMIAAAESGAFDLIITKEISRFARNTLDSIYYTRSLKRHGVGVIFLNDGINTLDNDAELRLAIMSSIAQEESRKTSERVKWGQKRRMEQGVVFGRSMLGYDVRDGKMYINEKGARIVRLIFHKFVYEGKGTHVIARELQEAGYFPMRGGRWQNTVILRIIRNEKYCGDLVQKKTYTPDFLTHEKKYNRGQEELIVIKDHHEPIISRELFNQAAGMLEAKSLSQEGRAKYSSRYPFSGKIKCARCGANYAARYRTRKNGSRYKAWRCYEAAKHGSPHLDQAGHQAGCAGESVRNEDFVYLMYLACSGLQIDRHKIAADLMRTIQGVVRMEAPDAEDISAAIDQIMHKRTCLIDLYTSGAIERAEFDTYRAVYNERIKELGTKMAGPEPQVPMEDIQNAVSELLGGVLYEDEYYARMLEKIVVNDKDHIDIYLKMLPYKWSYTSSKIDIEALKMKNEYDKIYLAKIK